MSFDEAVQVHDQGAINLRYYDMELFWQPVVFLTEIWQQGRSVVKKKTCDIYLFTHLQYHIYTDKGNSVTLTTTPPCPLAPLAILLYL